MIYNQQSLVSHLHCLGNIALPLDESKSGLGRRMELGMADQTIIRESDSQDH